MKDMLKNIGWGGASIIVFIVFVILIGFLSAGGLWISIKLWPLFSLISAIVIIAFCLVLLPLAAIKKTRQISAIGMIISSYVFGVTLWIWAFLLCFSIWGWTAIVVGLILAGIGVVPIALLATALKGMWSVFGQLLLLLILVFGARFFGAHLLAKYE